MKSGVESLRTVLADNPVESSNQRHSSNDGRSGSGSGSGSGVSQTEEAAATTTKVNKVLESRRSSQPRSQSGAWSFLPPSLTGKQPNNNRHSPPTSSPASSSTLHHRPTTTAGSIKSAGSTIADSVTESIKNLGTGLGLGQLAGGLGLTGNPGPGSYPARGSTGRSTQSHQQSRGGPYLNSTGGSSSRSLIWGWSGQDTTEEPEMGSDSDSIRSRGRHSGSSSRQGHKTETLWTGTKAEKAAKETAALLTKVREQQNEAMERARRMPEVEKMTQRYQDSWREIHDHTTRNSERADDADEILEKVLELCTRHVNASMQLAEETKDLGDMDKSMDEMVAMSENIHGKLVGLESKIAKLEEEAEVMSLADWKKTKTVELDKYMELKRKELWDKAEMLSTRSEQFQKEESARKLRQYQSQFQTDMEKFRRIQQEREQELWKVAEVEAEADAEAASESKTPENMSARIPSTNTHTGTGIISTTTAFVSVMDGHKQPTESVQQTKLLNGISVYDDEEEDQLREQEDLDRFLGSATESVGGDEGEEEEEEDDDDDEELSDDESEELDDEDDDEEEEDSSEDDLDPIAKARKARAAAAAVAAAAAAETRSGALQGASAGSTISTFSALVRNPSAMSLPKS
ncbi:hypothetical protein BG011_006292 [Mortierella polycephala]|uniref:Uncharacterized protein n=1 Tax=Mortierella polycephala TaxID=41804 RepID=A0A9P6TZ90_9FUNG|nr:hypothetical protein BG011_006292 [Mortierella polycephala]